MTPPLPHVSPDYTIPHGRGDHRELFKSLLWEIHFSANISLLSAEQPLHGQQQVSLLRQISLIHPVLPALGATGGLSLHQ